MSTKRKVQNELSLKRKVELIKFVNDGNTVRKAAQQFNLSIATVSRIKNRQAEYLRMSEEENIAVSRCRKIRRTENDQINELTRAWLLRARAMDLTVSGPMIKSAARCFSEKMGKTNFKASNGWLDSFRKALNEHGRAICFESSAAVDLSVVNNFMKHLPNLCEGYSPSEIFNAVETGLMYMALPDIKNLNGQRENAGKERLSVLLAASASGEKLKPLVIGKSAKPSCFKGIDSCDLPVIWRANKNCWMVSELFSEWVQDLNQSFRKQKRKVLLFIDNCAAHPDLQLSNIKLKHFPPNINSLSQPLEQGAIRAFKVLYRKELLRAIIGRSEAEMTADQVINSVTLLDAVYWIDKAWNQVKSTAILKCFKNIGFAVDEPTESDHPFDDDDDEISLQQLIIQTSAVLQISESVAEEKYLEFDNRIETFVTYTPEKVINEMTVESEMDTGPSHLTRCDNETEVPTSKEAAELFRKLKTFVLSRMPHHTGKLYDIEHDLNVDLVNSLQQL